VHNIYVYLIKQRRFKSNGGLLVFFYILACLVLVSRPGAFAFELFAIERTKGTWIFATIAGIAMLDIGVIMTVLIQQVKFMIETSD